MKTGEELDTLFDPNPKQHIISFLDIFCMVSVSDLDCLMYRTQYV